MNCWKTFNIFKQLGTTRLMVVSLGGAMSFYILFYLLMTVNGYNGPFRFNMLLFLGSIILVLPLHKLLHCLPAWLSGHEARVYFEKGQWMPRMQCVIPGAMPKKRYMSVTLAPFVILSLFSLGMTFTFPEEVHYLSAIGSLNFGMSVADILYFAHIVRAPAQSWVEEGPGHCRILIKNHEIA
ncbi:DUF3267 domain-containing protein [Tuberibacillus sp. Marseille-P3662]|uniref:DUF3267 domain-containing protein n=1 Tax=Tuberibacillus sp. Marseille-P3662 TaxID=1965358 RepID=UPI00159362C8|nr:DUF3267 domain-containing protein [Tuberibacillus sp. Marseille-P3662]